MQAVHPSFSRASPGIHGAEDDGVVRSRRENPRIAPVLGRFLYRSKAVFGRIHLQRIFGIPVSGNQNGAVFHFQGGGSGAPAVQDGDGFKGMACGQVTLCGETLPDAERFLQSAAQQDGSVFQPEAEAVVVGV